MYREWVRWNFFGQNSLIAVDHDHVITTVHVGGKGNLVLATQQNSSLGSNAAEGLARGVDHIPLAVSHLCGLCESSAHNVNLHPKSRAGKAPDLSSSAARGAAPFCASVIIANPRSFVNR